MTGMKLPQGLFVTMTIGLLLAGCGNQRNVSVTNAPQPQGKGEAAEQPQHGVVDLFEDDFEITKEETGIVAFVYKPKAPPLVDAEHLTAIRVHSAALAALKFNMQDFYVDGFTSDGMRVPFVQVQVANQDLAMKKDGVMLKLDGVRLAGTIEFQKRFIKAEDEEDLPGRQELRVLLSDNTLPGNPIVAGLIIPL